VDDRYLHLLEGLPATITRRYRGRRPTRAFEREAAILGERGYGPISQSWEQGSRGCGDFLLSLMLVSKPEATLTVTYARQVSTAPATPPSPPQERGTDDAASLEARLTKID
jgi:hypothetical protein